MSDSSGASGGGQTTVRRVFGIIGRVFGTLVLVGFLTGLIFSAIFAVYVKNYLEPELEMGLDNFSLNQTSVIYYYDDASDSYKELQKLYASENRIWAEYGELPQDLIFAAVAIEDKRFFDHNGVDWYRTVGAFGNMFLGMRDTFGGSTLTQQLIKNLTKEDEATVRRKLVEIFRALEFEKEYSKEEILEWYMNTIYLGESAYGVKSAAYVYFDKEVSDLSLAQCAALIGITNNPSIYDPYINEEKTRERQLLILKQMKEQGYISEEEYSQAVAEEMVYTRGESHEDVSTDIYSYFVDQIIRDVTSDLMEATGYSSAVVGQILNSGGYSIYSTIDLDVQRALESVYTDLENIPDTTDTTQQLQSAMCIVDNQSGDVVAMVGGVGEKEGSLTLNRATQSLRAPGSSIKPLTVYTPALELGLIDPATVYDDTPFTFEGGLWPKNYDSVYRGLMPMSTAVALSNNTIPAKLVNEMTPEYCFNFAVSRFGITTLVAAKEVAGSILSDVDIAPLALGGLTSGVSVEEMALAYAAFPNSGVYRSGRTYTKVVDPSGTVVLENKLESSVAMTEKTAFYINYMLEGVVENGTGTDAQIENMTVAGKTGTTTSDYDRWFCGYTPYYTAAVWVGYDTQEEIILKDSSVNPAAGLWRQVMEKIHEGLDDKSFSQPTNIVTATYCCDSGMLATQYCEQDARGSRAVVGQLALEDVPTSYCTLHVPVSLCNESDQLATEHCDSTHTAYLLNVLRQFPVSGVVVEDQQYMVGSLYGSVSDGYYEAVSEQQNAINAYCRIHLLTEDDEEEDEEEEAEEEEQAEITPPVFTGQDAGLPDVLPSGQQPNVVGGETGGTSEGGGPAEPEGEAPAQQTPVVEIPEEPAA